MYAQRDREHLHPHVFRLERRGGCNPDPSLPGAKGCLLRGRSSLCTVWKYSSAQCTLFALSLRVHVLISLQPAQDLDILILNTHYEQETIKRMLTNANSAFYTVASKTIGATYRVLWYHPLGWSMHRRADAVKVDILLPGIMDIPSFPATNIDTSNSRRLPAAPFSIVLLLKLQAWSQHRIATKTYLFSKHYTDASDLEALVPLAATKGVRISETVLPSSFVEVAKARVLEYLRRYPDSRTVNGWRTIGFSVPAATVPTATARSSVLARRYYSYAFDY